MLPNTIDKLPENAVTKDNRLQVEWVLYLKQDQNIFSHKGLTASFAITANGNIYFKPE